MFFIIFNFIFDSILKVQEESAEAVAILSHVISFNKCILR